MSNYSWLDLPEQLAEFKGRIVVGGEVINGTGHVEARLSSDDSPDPEDYVILSMDNEQAKALALLIWQAASEAEWCQRWNNR